MFPIILLYTFKKITNGIYYFERGQTKKGMQAYALVA